MGRGHGRRRGAQYHDDRLGWLGGPIVRILVVYQYYLQPGHPGFSRFNEFARFWSQAGHQVTVITGTIDYASGRASRQYWWRWNTREQDGPVSVWRCHVPQTYAKSYLGRMWAFFGFTLSALTAALRSEKADVVIASSPPLVVAFPAWLAARLHRARLIFEVRDLHPESAVTTGVLAPDALLTRLLYAVERWAYAAADRVNVLTPAFREDLLRRGVATDDKIIVIPNGADLDLFSPGPRDNEVRRELGWGDRFVVMYAGAHGRANAIGQLVDAAERLRDRKDILIATVGDGPERARHEEAARQRGLDNIQFCGPQPKSRMAQVVNACDVGAAVLQDNPTFRTVYPNKVFDYMACARPTLLAIDGAARRLVCEEARAGVFARPEDGGALADAIRALAGDPEACAEMGRRGRAWVVANSSREALAGRYLDAMLGALGKAAPAPAAEGRA
jgi:glycosyltransferase involved in cell wall biosynthesis